MQILVLKQRNSGTAPSNKPLAFVNRGVSLTDCEWEEMIEWATSKALGYANVWIQAEIIELARGSYNRVLEPTEDISEVLHECDYSPGR